MRPRTLCAPFGMLGRDQIVVLATSVGPMGESVLAPLASSLYVFESDMYDLIPADDHGYPPPPRS